MALELGLQPSQIRQSIRNNLQDIGRPFRSMDCFIQQILTQDQSSLASNRYLITQIFTLKFKIKKKKFLGNIFICKILFEMKMK